LLPSSIGSPSISERKAIEFGSSDSSGGPEPHTSKMNPLYAILIISKSYDPNILAFKNSFKVSNVQWQSNASSGIL